MKPQAVIHLVSGWTTKRKVCTLNLLVDLDGVAEMQTVGCILQSFLLGAAWMAWQKPGRFNMWKKNTGKRILVGDIPFLYSFSLNIFQTETEQRIHSTMDITDFFRGCRHLSTCRPNPGDTQRRIAGRSVTSVASIYITGTRPLGLSSIAMAKRPSMDC